MEALFIYLIKSSALIGMFYVAYHFLLRKETFFTSNRWFLLAGLFTSVILPLLVYTKSVWVTPTPTRFDWSNIPVTAPIQNDTFEINWYLALVMAYAIGIALFLLQFTFDFFSLTKILKNKTIQQQADYKFIDVAENVAPFSYFNYIVYNSSLYSPSELENILEHEKVHSAQHHTIDLLISRFFCVMFWYNPFVWLYKKAILQNLEFIADSEASKKIADKKAYQITLLKITTHENCVAITNHFYQSLIKKRIVMLNKNQSNKWNSWKYALVVPVLAAFMLYFQVKIVAQEKNYVNKTEVIEASQVVICKTSTDDYIKESCDRIKKEHNIDLKFFKIKRNSQGEILSIEGTFDDNKGTNGNYRQSRDTPINTIKFLIQKRKSGNDQIGFHNADDEDTIENGDFIADVETQEESSLLSLPSLPTLPTLPGLPDFPDFPELPSLSTPTAPSVPAKPIIIINGKRVDANMEDYSDTDPDLIESMNVLKGISGEEKYGKDGQNGVIEIVTKDKKKLAKSTVKRREVEIEIRKQVKEEVEAEMERIKPEIEKAKKEAMESRKVALESKKEAVKARNEAMKEREKALKEAKKAREKTEKEKN